MRQATESRTAAEIPWSTIGYLVAKRTYARRLVEDDVDSPTEEWEDIVERVVKASNEQLNCMFSEKEQEQLRRYLLELKGLVAGRFLWQLGTKTVDRLGLASLQNCAFTTVNNPEAFCWTFDLLMLGSGVGYNIQREYVQQLPPVSPDFRRPVRNDSPSADFIVPDTREGWVQLLRETLRSAFGQPASYPKGFSYSTQLIRSKGAPIKGFGGVASGPEDLVRGIEQISLILESCRGQKLRPIHCLDIMNIIGSIVVAGNVRRSAQIAIGDYDDEEYLKAKRWDLGPIPPWRSNSNNSVVCDDTSKLPQLFWDGYEGKGEPYGLINLDLARKVGRSFDTRYPDPRVAGMNPCAEQTLEDGETCCLAEIVLPNVESKEELLDIAKLLYRVCKHSLALDCHLPKTAMVVHRNMRMGIGVTGYLQASEEQRSWLPLVYEELREFDKEYSALMGFPTSIKLTTVKPSGTLSLLPGVTPGCHPAYATYMIRRISVSANSPLVEVCRRNGYKVEYRRQLDGTEDHSTVIVEFPFSYPEGTPVANEFSAIDQLEVVRRLQREWSDNSVSCTVYYRPEELASIKAYLAEHYKDNFKSLSFLLHQGHGFDQAPYEEISKEYFEEMVKGTRLITSINSAEFESDDECAGGVCPIK